MGSLLFLLKVTLSSASFVLVFIFFLLDLMFLVAGEEGSIVERFEDNALTIYPNELSKKSQKALAKAKYFEEEYRARLARVKERRKELDENLQICRDGLANVEQLKRELEKAERPEPVETCCEAHEESVWSFI
ncbi:unnamed protein product [Brassica rapa]|uniref:Uncharacterized protein n=1 Tax=Brassica campestris TaxID=3711 RepID=A0A8D9DAD2_BRACM|nr:unnamed protein product [Brassica rapa]